MAKSPSFWNPNEIGAHRKPNLAQARVEGLAAKLSPAHKDKVRRIAVGIDYQVDFVRDDGSLKVGGALDDTKRYIEYLYGNAEYISAVLLSLDQHLPWQIFFPLWWKDKNGNHPQPFTIISEQDVNNGIWIPQRMKLWSRAYPKRLRETGQSPLIIWPEHCLAGSEGASLTADLAEAIMWLSAARGLQPIYMFKGMVPESEHYGPFCCCVPVANHPQGGLQTQFMNMIANHDIIDISGEAEDFCVREGMRQLLKYYSGKNPVVIKKMRFLKDCTSLVYPDNRVEADAVLNDYTKQGVKVMKSTEV